MTVEPDLGAGGDTDLSDWQGKRVLVLSPTPTSPQNYGNRRRIRRVCSDIKAAGGEITFVHYTSELEWRDILPADAQAEMCEMWDHYYVVPPTVWLHCDPAGEHHEIDEWWDPAIETFLRWIFQRSRFDVFIVNYTWLSRALTIAPSGVLRVLDTHDRFAERKELLQANGIAPEFFYLSDDAAEKEALDRADIVWAIKEQEAVHFSGFVDSPVVAVPYMQDKAELPVAPIDPDGVLRLGVIGAGNSINKINIERFVTVFRDIARMYFAPVQLVIAGSVCDVLDVTEDRLVRCVGRVEAVEDFYGSVDVVCIPMDFSTGLKVKTGEALSFGLPVVSTAHGFEGYSTTERLHQLEDLTAVAKAAVALSFEPKERLTALRQASRDVAERVLTAIQGGMRATLDLAEEKYQGAFLVDADMLSDSSVLSEAVLHSVEFSSYVGGTNIFVVAGTLAPGQVLDRLIARTGSVTVDPSVTLTGSLARGRVGLQVATFEQFLERIRPKLVVLDTVLSPEQLHVAQQANLIWSARPALMALRDVEQTEHQLQVLTPAHLMVSRDTPQTMHMAKRWRSEILTCPLFGSATPTAKSGVPSKAYIRPDVLIMAKSSDARADLIKAAFSDLGWRVMVARCGLPSNGSLTASHAAAIDGAQEMPMVDDVSARWVIEQIGASGTEPVVAIDLTDEAFAALALLELLHCRCVPVLSFAPRPLAEAHPYLRLDQTGRGLWRLLSEALPYLERYPQQFGVSERDRFMMAKEYNSEAGWPMVWKLFTTAGAGSNSDHLDLGL